MYELGKKDIGITLVSLVLVLVMLYHARRRALSYVRWILTNKSPLAEPCPCLIIKDSARVRAPDPISSVCFSVIRPSRYDKGRQARPSDLGCLRSIAVTAPEGSPGISRSLFAERSHPFGKVISSGRFGRVEKGQYERRDVAVKFAKEGNNRDTILEAFTAEIECFEKIPTHGNVIKCFGGRLGHPGSYSATADVTKDEIFIVEELMDGNLRDIITGKSTPWEKWTYRHMLCIFREIAVGLEHLHSCNVLHYDLKPENILIRVIERDFPLEIKLADFGCSRIKIHTYTMVKHAGTMLYMAPEISLSCRALFKVNGKIDVYSMGIVMWEILTGINLISSALPVQPGSSFSGYEICDCKVRYPIADYHPAGIRKLIWECLEFRKSNRLTAREVVAAIGSMMHSDWIVDEVIREGAKRPQHLSEIKSESRNSAEV